MPEESCLTPGVYQHSPLFVSQIHGLSASEGIIQFLFSRTYFKHATIWVLEEDFKLEGKSRAHVQFREEMVGSQDKGS